MDTKITQQERPKQEVRLNIKQSNPTNMALKKTLGVIILLIFIAIIALIAAPKDTQTHTNAVGFGRLEDSCREPKVHIEKVNKKPVKKRKKNSIDSERNHYLSKFS